MSVPADIPAELSDEAMLSRLAACDFSAAEKVHAKLMAAEEASEIAELGRAYQRFARSLRQTLALKARLKREAAQAEREARPPPEAPGGVAIARRQGDVRAAVTRVIWNEALTEAEAADFEDRLDIVLASARTRADFCAEPLDDQVVRLCLDLDLSPDAAMTWRDLPDPDASPSPDKASGWRGAG